MSEILRLPDDCSRQCQNCEHHNQEKRERAVPEKALILQMFDGDILSNKETIRAEALKQVNRINDIESRLSQALNQIAELTEELIEEFEEVVEFAPECTSSKEYAEKRLKELKGGDA